MRDYEHSDEQEEKFRAAELASWMIVTMMADGKIDDGEKEVILEFARNRGIGRDQLKMLVAAAEAGSLGVSVPSSPDEAAEWIEEMLRMAMADGEISKAELASINSLAVSVGMNRDQLRQMIEGVRDDLADLSREVMRRTKKRR